MTFSSTDGSFDLRNGSSTKSINVTFSDTSSASLSASFGSSSKIPTSYNNLFNKPKINGTTLGGSIALAELGLRPIYYDTTASWDTQASLVSEEGALYIYSDYQTVTDESGNVTYIPGLRIGDGSTYLIDLPFLSNDVTVAFYEHVNDTDSHVSAQEKAFWNNKVSSYLDPEDAENLVLSKTNYII